MSMESKLQQPYLSNQLKAILNIQAKLQTRAIEITTRAQAMLAWLPKVVKAIAQLPERNNNLQPRFKTRKAFRNNLLSKSNPLLKTVLTSQKHQLITRKHSIKTKKIQVRQGFAYIKIQAGLI